MEQEYCRWLLAQDPARVGEVRFCRFDRASGQFVEVPPQDVAACLQMPQAGAPAITAAHRSRLRGALSSLLAGLPERLAAPVYRVAHRFFLLRARVGPQARRWWRRARPPLPAPFQTGDRWVSMGLDWDTLDQQALYEARLRHRLDVTLMCYDVIPALFPHLVVLPPGNFAAYIVDAAWCADRIVCISEHTRRDLEALLRRLGAPVPPCEVVRLGSEVAPGALARPPAGLPEADRRPFVLFVSTVERRKNHELLYRAWRRLREEGFEPHRLVFVGMPGWGVSDLLNDLRLDPRVQGDILMLDRVDDAELAWLYQNCAFTVFPSLYEGWGLPVAESLAWGRVCLASHAASLPEVGGNLVEYLDPWDLPAWVERLRHYMTDPQHLAERAARISQTHVPTRWADTAAALHRIACGGVCAP